MNTHRLTESSFKEKPVIEPATPGLQDIGLSPTPWKRLIKNFADEKREDINIKRALGTDSFKPCFLQLICYVSSHFRLVLSGESALEVSANSYSTL